MPKKKKKVVKKVLKLVKKKVKKQKLNGDVSKSGSTDKTLVSKSMCNLIELNFSYVL